jgi:hypothetical protein
VLQEVRQQAQVEQDTGRREAAAQAITIFGGVAEKAEKNAEAAKTLDYLERGVKKMTKGLLGVS